MKILVVRFSSIGDVVLTTPVIRCLHEQLPNAEIHFITKKTFQSLLVDNKRVTKIYTIEKSINEVIVALKQENYDLVIDLHKNVRTFALKRKLGVKSYSFRKLNFQKLLLVKLKWNRMPKIHIVDRYFEAVESLGVKNDLKSCELFFSTSDYVDVSTVHLKVKSFLAVAVGAQFETKVMPPNQLAEILKKITYPIILLGGPNDVESGKLIENELNNQPVVNAVNQFSLLQSASILAQAKVLLTHDTGLMHLATCFDIPIVSIWGNTVPELGMFPYYPNRENLFSIHEVEGLSCRPCSKIGYHSCPKKHFNCMKLQDKAAIVNQINLRIEVEPTIVD